VVGEFVKKEWAMKVERLSGDTAEGGRAMFAKGQKLVQATRELRSWEKPPDKRGLKKISGRKTLTGSIRK